MLDLSNQLDLKEQLVNESGIFLLNNTAMAWYLNVSIRSASVLIISHTDTFLLCFFFCLFVFTITMALYKHSLHCKTQRCNGGETKLPTLTLRACRVDSSDSFSRVAGSVDEVYNHQ